MSLPSERVSPLCLSRQVWMLLRNCVLTAVSSFRWSNLITFTGKGWRATKKKKINWRRVIVRTEA